MDPPAATDHSSEAQNKDPDNKSSRRRESFASQDSQTASEYVFRWSSFLVCGPISKLILNI